MGLIFTKSRIAHFLDNCGKEQTILNYHYFNESYYILKTKKYSRYKESESPFTFLS